MRTFWSVGVFVIGLIAAALPAYAQNTPRLDNAVGRSGVGFYTPGEWGVLGASIENPRDTEAAPLYSVAADNATGVEFVRQLWLPPRSRLAVDLPFMLLREPEGESLGAELNAQLLGRSEGRYVAVDSAKGMINVRDEPIEVAVMPGSSEGSDDASQLSVALREAAGLKPTTAYLNSRLMPSVASGWDAVDAVVLAAPDAEIDAAQIEALRRWVLGGGRLWIQLDRVSPALARSLLGDDWNVSVIDRIGLTDFNLESEEASQHVTSDYPIDLVRVVAPDMEVTHRVNGHPAALRKQVGRGELIVTTLQPKAWLTNDEAEAATPALAELTSFVRPGRTEAATRFAEARAEALGQVAARQIGYEVMSRGPVVAVLSLFALTLLAGGLFLAQKEKLAQLGWIAPLMAVIAAAIILGLGLARQSETSFTLASAQLIEPLPGKPYARVASTIGIYTPPGAPSSDAVFQGRGPVAWPDLGNRGGEHIRVIWESEDRWRFAGMAFREGAVQQAYRNAVVPIEGPAAARVRFSEEGLEGQIVAPGMGTLEDLVIATPAGKLSVIDPSGEPDRFVAPAADPLGPDTFFAGGLLGQREMDRQEIYRRMLAAPGFPEGPLLLGWTSGIDTDLSVSDAAEEALTGLVALPLVIERPEPGTRVAVPDAFLGMSNYLGDAFPHGAPAYDERNGEWVTDIAYSSVVLMEYSVPAALRPLDVDAGQLTFDLQAPGRPYEIVSAHNGELVTVASGTNAAGQQTVEFTADNAPTPLENGTVVVGIRIGDPLDPTTREPWGMRRMDLNIAGTVAPQP